LCLEQKHCTPRETPEPLSSAALGLVEVHRVLLIRLRSIGDTVLSTPSLSRCAFPA
jgi:hypothetical protein